MKLNIKEITKSYGSNLALDHFSTELEPGIYALLGPNGSGKSTLMNIITDNLKADSGEITYTSDGNITENVLKMGVRFREKLGFMPQYPGLYPNFTVEQVWNIPCNESDVQSIQEQLRVINIARDDTTGNVLLRVLSDILPHNSAVSVKLTLEDYYLYIFGD